jgi:hypothetical protein
VLRPSRTVSGSSMMCRGRSPAPSWEGGLHGLPRSRCPRRQPGWAPGDVQIAPVRAGWPRLPHLSLQNMRRVRPPRHEFHVKPAGDGPSLQPMRRGVHQHRVSGVRRTPAGSPSGPSIWQRRCHRSVVPPPRASAACTCNRRGARRVQDTSAASCADLGTTWSCSAHASVPRGAGRLGRSRSQLVKRGTRGTRRVGREQSHGPPEPPGRSAGRLHMQWELGRARPFLWFSACASRWPQRFHVKPAAASTNDAVTVVRGRRPMRRTPSGELHRDPAPMHPAASSGVRRPGR